MKLSKNCVWWISCKDNGGVLKTKYDTDKSDLEKKISNPDENIFGTSGVVKWFSYYCCINCSWK